MPFWNNNNDNNPPTYLHIFKNNVTCELWDLILADGFPVCSFKFVVLCSLPLLHFALIIITRRVFGGVKLQVLEEVVIIVIVVPGQ